LHSDAGVGLPSDHHLVDFPAVAVSPDAPLGLVDELEYFLVGLSPVKLANIVGDVPVE